MIVGPSGLKIQKLPLQHTAALWVYKQMRLKETIMIISFSLLLLKVKCTQAFLTVGVEAGWGVGGLQIRVARVEARGGRTVYCNIR